MIHRFWTSIFGVMDYRGLIAAGAGRAAGQMLLLLLALVLIQSVSFQRNTNEVLRALSEEIAEWPDFRLAHGRFEFFGPMPHVAGQGDTTLIIDTEGERGRELFDACTEGILITEREVLYKKAGSAVTTSRWADIPLSTSRDRFARSLPGLLWPIVIVTELFKILWHAVAKSFGAVLLGLLGLLTAGGRLRFGQAFTIGLYALTGPILLSIARAAAFPALPFSLSLAFFLAYWGWAVIVTVAAVTFIKREDAGAAAALTAAAGEGDDGDGNFKLI